VSFWEVARELEGAGTPFGVVTLLSARGHAPQDPGAKAIVTAEGLRWGTVGGGKIEARAIERARMRLLQRPADNAPEVITWNLQRDIGMTCGGEVTLLFEIHGRPLWRIVVFGAGHVAQALVRALGPLDCHVTCVDARAEWVNRLPDSSRLRALCEPDPAAWVEKLDRDSFFVVMTQGHATDLPILEALFRLFPKAPYIGAIGSDVKAARFRAELRSRGFSDEQVLSLRSPIGLPIGSHHPAEIAISVLAEMLQVRDAMTRRLAPDPSDC
jgi:xanthine dehydrogenase accessory factor